MVARSLNRAQAIDSIAELRRNLDLALDEIDAQRRNATLSIEYQTYLNDYAAVRIAGYFEQLCFHAISGRVGEATTGHVQMFVNSWFHRSPNLNPKQLQDLFARFGPDVKSAIQSFLDEGLNREVLSSLLERRNAVAHGTEYSQTGRSSLESSRDMLDKLDRLVHSILLDSEPLVT